MARAGASALLVLALALALGGAAPVAAQTGAEAARPSFQPPDEAQLADDEFGREVRLGKALFMQTDTRLPQYVGNHLQCASCHLDAGRKTDAAPLWGAYGMYPAYRRKNGHVNTFNERLRECFRYSMNGRMPPADDPALTALETYAYWMARGAPLGVRLAGAGLPRLPQPGLAPDYARGEALYGERCAACHRTDGAGAAGPALWGAGSYNWGAGMERVGSAAGFIEANMPLGQGHSLSTQQAWDVALFVDSHERPQDPRFITSVAVTRAKFHDDAESMYGTSVGGHVLGSESRP